MLSGGSDFAIRSIATFDDRLENYARVNFELNVLLKWITYAVPNKDLRTLADHHVHALGHKLLLPGEDHVSARRDMLPRMYLSQRLLELVEPLHVAVRHDVDVSQPLPSVRRADLPDLLHYLLNCWHAATQIDVHAMMVGALGALPRVDELREAVERVEVRGPAAQVLAVLEEVAAPEVQREQPVEVPLVVLLEARRWREEIAVCLKGLVRERRPAEELDNRRVFEQWPDREHPVAIAKHTTARIRISDAS